MFKEADERLLRKTYSEIVNGFSIARLKDRDVYIRHASTLDNLEIDYLYMELYNSAVAKDYPTEADRLESLKKDGLWAEINDEQMETIKSSIRNLFAAKRKAFRTVDIDSVNSQIQEQEKTYIELFRKRELLVGNTAEKFTTKRVDAFHISQSFFKNKSLTEPLFCTEEFDNLETEELDSVYAIYYNIIDSLNEKRIKKIALADFFLNVFQLSESIYQFFGKPLASLTHYQIQLCAYGNFFKNILTSEPKPSEEIASDPDKLEDWYFGRTNAEEELKRLKKDGNEDATLVGLSEKDREFLGYENPEKMDMSKKIKDAGGELSMEELIKLDGM